MLYSIDCLQEQLKYSINRKKIDNQTEVDNHEKHSYIICLINMIFVSIIKQVLNLKL